MPNKFGVEYVTRAGVWPFLHASWSCFEEHDGRHAHILTLQGFDHHFSGSVHQFVCACSQQSSMASLSSRSSVGYAESLQPFRTQIVLAVWQHFGNHLSCPCATCAPPWHEPLPKSTREMDRGWCLVLCGSMPNPKRPKDAHQWLEFSLPPLLP